MIRSVRGSATGHFIESGKCKFSGLDIGVAQQRLAELNAATSLDDLLRLRSARLHKLKGNLGGFWSIDVNGLWRVLFAFKHGHAYEVHIHDPH